MIIRKINNRILTGFVGLMLFLLPWPVFSSEKMIKKVLTIKKHKLEVEIADTVLKRSTGLMYREKMDKDAGMLFVFPVPDRVGFWMKNTKIPLSIAFIDSDGVILQIADMKPEDITTIMSKEEVSYALEVNQGWFKKNNIKFGDIIKGLEDIN